MADALSDRILQARKEAQLSREAVAVTLGVSLRTVARWETGETANITATRLAQIAQTTGKPLSFFLHEAAA